MANNSKNPDTRIGTNQWPHKIKNRRKVCPIPAATGFAEKKSASLMTDLCNTSKRVLHGSCSNVLISGQNVFLHASEGVILMGDFYVPIGAQIYIDANPCY
jgi:hypothetical protein